MSSNTFKWLGGQGGGENANSFSNLSDWLIQQGSIFVAAGVLPAAGATILVDTGTIVDSGVNLTANTIDLQGSNVLLDVKAVTIDAASIVTTGTTGTASLLVETGVVNNGTLVAAGAGASLDLELVADLSNGGLLSASAGGALSASYDGGTLVNTGTVQALAGSFVTLSTLVTNTGTVLAAGGSVTIDVSSGNGMLEATLGGTLNATAINGGTVLAQGGSATLGVVAGGTLLEIGGGGTLTVGDAYASVPILFLDSTGTLVIRGAVAGSILGFGTGDVIDLPNADFARLRPITVSGDNAFVGGVKLDLAGSDLTAADFTVKADATGGTLLTAPGLSSDTWLSPVDGNWSDAGHWSSGAPPGTADQALIVNSTGAAFTVGATNEVALSLTLQAQAGTLDLNGSFGARNGIVDVAGTLVIEAGATVTSGSYTGLTGATLTMGTGSALILSGALNVAGPLALTDGVAVRAAGLDVTGTLSIDGKSSLAIGGGGAGPGALLIAADTTLAPGGVIRVPTLDVLGNVAFGGGGDVVVSGAVTGSGTIEVGTAGTPAVFEMQSATAFSNTIALDGTLTLSHAAGYHGTVDIAVDTGTASHVTPASAFAVFDLRDIAIGAAKAVWNANTGIASLGTLAPFKVVPTDMSEPRWTISDDGAGGTEVTFSDLTVCYVAGTRIATPGGAAPVEALRPGDLVLVQEGADWVPRPVRWVGFTRVDLDRHISPSRAAPIRIRAHAFAPNVPSRDLRVSPDHAVLADGVLVQAQSLVNGATILQEAGSGRVTYCHVELERHALLLAEGLPAESYLDTGNRGWFAAEIGVRPLFPDFTGLAAWHRDGCAKLLLEGATLRAIHGRLLARARAFGHRLTDDPRLQVLANGVALPLADRGRRTWRAMLPAGTRRVQLASRSFVPDWLDRGADDRRRLGVAIAKLRLDGRPLAARAFGAGWHAAEAEWRWTDGSAGLNLAPRPQPATLTLQIAAAAPGYWDAPVAALRDAA